MSKNRDRRRHSREFKLEAVRLVTEGGRSKTEVARNLGIHVNLLYKWTNQFLSDGEKSFPGVGHPRTYDEENQQLKHELADVKEERDILKKALAIFSRRPR